MRKALISALFVLVVAMAVAVQAGEKDAWRVGTKLIRVGDTKQKVLFTAGKPDLSYSITTTEFAGGHSSCESKDGEFRCEHRDLEPYENVINVWTYKEGMKITNLYFSEGRLIKITWERL